MGPASGHLAVKGKEHVRASERILPRCCPLRGYCGVPPHDRTASLLAAINPARCPRNEVMAETGAGAQDPVVHQIDPGVDDPDSTAFLNTRLLANVFATAETAPNGHC